MKLKIGVLGGTFDPIHNGHLKLAENAMKELALDKMIFIPTGVSYMKTGVTKAAHRYEMCRLALAEFEKFELDDVEMKREGNTYTCETLQYLHERYTDADIYFIIGLDTLFSIEKWKNVSFVLKHCILVCADRNCDDISSSSKERIRYLENEYQARIKVLQMEAFDASSTEIRELYRTNNKSDKLKILVPYSVHKYIMQQDLYTEYDKMCREISLQLKPKRFKHTLGVVEMAKKLARLYGADCEKAAIAALLHDCAKHMPLDEMIEICRQNDVLISDIEMHSPALIHGKAGALLAQTRYGVYDAEIYDAIFYHTTGKDAMSLLTQIIFVSDYIEPNRIHSDKLPQLRALAEIDLNKTTAIILQDTLKYLEEAKDDVIDAMTAVAFAYYKKYL